MGINSISLLWQPTYYKTTNIYLLHCEATKAGDEWPSDVGDDAATVPICEVVYSTAQVALHITTGLPIGVALSEQQRALKTDYPTTFDC